MALMDKIRGVYFRDKKTISEIARLRSLSRNTNQAVAKGGAGHATEIPAPAALTKALEMDATGRGASGARCVRCTPDSKLRTARAATCA